MQCASCQGFFPFPATDNCPPEHFVYCSKCRCASEYDYSYTSKDYEHENITNMFYIGEKDEY